jgi:hypothetical protein
MGNAAFSRWRHTQRRVFSGLSFHDWRTVRDIRFYMSAPLLTPNAIRRHLKSMVETGKVIWRPINSGRNIEKEYLKTE